MNKIHHKPYVPSNSVMKEFTPKAVLLGILFGLVFGATTSYLALKVGLTVSASIPIAVLAISLFKRFGNSTILENNIVQTIGSAGESVASGVAFTLPALLFLSHGAEYFNYLQIFVLALSGGVLGTLLMIPLRKSLIVDEYPALPYPEGLACADILIAGEKKGGFAEKVYYGILIAFFYKLLMSIIGLWKEIPEYVFSRKSVLPNASLSAEITPELLGVGYIIGFKSSAILVAGGIMSALVLTPLITYYGDLAAKIIPPGVGLIADMTPMQIWSQYIRYIGAGAVTFGGVVTMIRTFPTMLSTLRHTVHRARASRVETKEVVHRVDRDLPFSFIFIGIVLLFAAMIMIPEVPVTIYSSVIILIAGFIFVSVSSRIVGIIGLSSNPISGMTIATLMATCLLFIISGFGANIYQPVALCVGAIVAIAAANAGATSQDLRTGFLVGATPIKQQVGIMIGVVSSALAVGFTIMLLHNTLGFGEVTPEHARPLPAPQAMLMSTIVKGLFDQNLPWSLVVIGMGIALVVELCGVNSLSFAVGLYLPLATTSPIFIGGLIKWMVSERKSIKPENAELESGALYSSGLIAGGALTGILVAVLLGTTIGIDAHGSPVVLMDKVNTGIDEVMGPFGDLISINCFLILCATLFFFGIQKDKKVV